MKNTSIKSGDKNMNIIALIILMIFFVASFIKEVYDGLLNEDVSVIFFMFQLTAMSSLLFALFIGAVINNVVRSIVKPKDWAWRAFSSVILSYISVLFAFYFFGSADLIIPIAVSTIIALTSVVFPILFKKRFQVRLSMYHYSEAGETVPPPEENVDIAQALVLAAIFSENNN